jgi:hypothetical protein
MMNIEKLGVFTAELIIAFFITIICWLITYLFIIEIPLWKLFLIEIIYVMLNKFHIFIINQKRNSNEVEKPS